MAPFFLRVFQAFPIILLFLFSECTPPPPVIPKCPEPFWKKYSHFNSYQVTEETDRLTALLAAGDTVCRDPGCRGDSTDTITGNRLTALEIKWRLFELAIHHANPVFDLDTIFDYVSFLYQQGGPDSLRYLNWGRVAREFKMYVHSRDSLEGIITGITEGEEEGSRQMKKLKEQKREYIRQCDSLNAVIASQKEMIMKLQKLDVMMEKQRTRIQ